MLPTPQRDRVEGAGDREGGLPPLWLATALWSGYTATLTVAATAVARRREIG